MSSPWLCRSYLEERLPHCVQFASRTSVAPASGSLTHFLSLNSTRVDHRNQNPRQLDSRNTLNLSGPLTYLKDFCKDPMTLMPSIRSQTGFSFPSAPTSSVPSRSTKKNCHQSTRYLQFHNPHEHARMPGHEQFKDLLGSIAQRPHHLSGGGSPKPIE